MGLAKEFQQPLGRAAQRSGTRNARETLHRGIPRDHGQAGVGDDHRVVETVDDARSKVVHVLDEYSASGAQLRSRALCPPAARHRAMCHNRAMRAHLSTLVLAIVALMLGVIAYLKDPGLPALGARNGVSMLVFILPRMVPAILIAGLMQVLIPQETVSQYLGQQSGFAAIVVASLIGVFTPGGRW